MAMVVEGVGLGRRFASLRAVADLDLQVQTGESLTIFGPNGAGKTTLVKLLAGLLRPTQGELRLFGEEHPRPSLRRRIGLVSHGSFLYGDLTAVENLRFYGRLFAVADVEPRIDELLGEVGLAAWRERPVRTFSRGMEQRLALARAFLHDPDLLLLDEPYTGLDPQAAGHLQEILQRFHRRGKTIVVTTHDIGRGLEVCDRAVILSGGRLVWRSGRFVPGPQEMARIYERQVVNRAGAGA
ncbi:MAG: heme ABC exporter ATP-binding protein CcmA [Candidatus Binatia bacterium]